MRRRLVLLSVATWLAIAGGVAAAGPATAGGPPQPFDHDCRWWTQCNTGKHVGWPAGEHPGRNLGG